MLLTILTSFLEVRKNQPFFHIVTPVRSSHFCFIFLHTYIVGVFPDVIIFIEIKKSLRTVFRCFLIQCITLYCSIFKVLHQVSPFLFLAYISHILKNEHNNIFFLFGNETNQFLFSLFDFVCLNYHFFTKLYFVVIMFCEKQKKTKYHSGLFNMTKGGGGIGGCGRYI